MNYQTLTLPQIYDEAEAVAGDANTFFGQLNSEQLNWKPAADSWSVAQCLDHLISANREYYPVFDRILKGEYRKTFLHQYAVSSCVIRPCDDQGGFAGLSAEVQSPWRRAAFVKLD